MAHLSQDAHMIEAFRSGADIHAATAAKIYGIPVEEVTSDMRRKAKTANFGIIYGISVFGLAERLNIPRAESKELIEGYFKTYPDIRAYMDESIEVAKEKGYVETIYKRKRFLPDINSHNAIVRGICRTKRDQRSDPGQCCRYHQGGHGPHLQPFRNRGSEKQDDPPGTR